MDITYMYGDSATWENGSPTLSLGFLAFYAVCFGEKLILAFLVPVWNVANLQLSFVAKNASAAKLSAFVVCSNPMFTLHFTGYRSGQGSTLSVVTYQN